MGTCKWATPLPAIPEAGTQPADIPRVDNKRALMCLQP